MLTAGIGIWRITFALGDYAGFEGCARWAAYRNIPTFNSLNG
jgi:hypothetical protein